ncbi:Hypothetical protein FKW44_006836 [Caligus rogercresseyi]|uniref:Uncharacterized protein n=1 Tax=Caligus rogercresseyi TaxID=217165 RepID=A0A7T8KDW7_CALRO|nr:Hypothetical protein FKW44_006836 [Caligus rogercresseyi]
MNTHLYKMVQSSTPVCRLCKEEEETHIPFKCMCPQTRMEMDELSKEETRRK